MSIEIPSGQNESRPILVSLAEAGRLLGVSRRTVVRLCQSGRLAIVRLTPDTPRVRFDDVMRLAHPHPASSPGPDPS